MKIKDIMTQPAITVLPDDTIYQVSQVMQENNIGALPVCDDGKLVGIVTDRDIIIRNVARGLDPKMHPVREIMTTKVHTVTPDSGVSEAVKLMSTVKARRLPVVDQDSVVGFVAIGDMAVTGDYVTEVGGALSDISVPCHKKHS